MHDPVDKALDVPDHQARAARYARQALGKRVRYREMARAATSADVSAATADRLPMPSAGGGRRSVGPGGRRLTIRHPVSAQEDEIDDVALDEAYVCGVIDDIVGALPKDPRTRFLALWRLLPERLRPGLARLPADMRVPDHTLIQHADITTGIATARQRGRGYTYLSVALGPVQAFIEAARSVRDLWSGSALLSRLMFQGMRPVLERLGPTALVFPALRSNPLADLWLRDECGLKDLLPPPSKKARRAPSLPNRFLALVPSGEDEQIASKCKESILQGWYRVADTVHRHLDSEMRRWSTDWDRLWQTQVDSFFEITVSLLPEPPLSDETLAGLVGGVRNFKEVWKEAGRVRELAEKIPEGERPHYSQDGAGQWQAHMELSARMMEARRAIRHIPVTRSGRFSPPKCSLLGSYEQMGPMELGASARFWQQAQKSHLRLRARERFSAIALSKRFAAETFLYQELQLTKEDLRFPDTATVAAQAWLKEASIPAVGNWNGRWLHQKRRDDVEEGEKMPPADTWRRIRDARKSDHLGNPPSYYAVLMMDADDMGLWLKGDHAPKVSEVMHPKLAGYFRQLDSERVEARRPVGPALHAAISEALNNFASHLAPKIVKRYDGTMIYSGGDDLLALVPARRALTCANELRKAFQGYDEACPGWHRYDSGRHFLCMGHKATLSAGIAIVHYKYDLRAAIEDARKAEKASKNRGKNRVTLGLVRRSGNRQMLELAWKRVPWLDSITGAFAAGASDRWLYTLQRELPALGNGVLPAAAISAEVRRLVARTRDASVGSELDTAEWWAAFCELGEPSLAEFTGLCLGASFIARGYYR